MNKVDFYYCTLRLQAYYLLFAEGKAIVDLDFKYLIEAEIAKIQVFLDSIKEGE